MPKVLTCLLALLAITAPAFGGDGWTRLKTGMTRKETAAIVGLPLFSNAGHGYEAWFYDQRGEVMLYRGRVLYWNAPRAAEGRKPQAVSPDAPRTTRPESVSATIDESLPGGHTAGEQEARTRPAKART